VVNFFLWLRFFSRFCLTSTKVANHFETFSYFLFTTPSLPLVSERQKNKSLLLCCRIFRFIFRLRYCCMTVSNADAVAATIVMMMTDG